MPCSFDSLFLVSLGLNVSVCLDLLSALVQNRKVAAAAAVVDEKQDVEDDADMLAMRARLQKLQ